MPLPYAAAALVVLVLDSGYFFSDLVRQSAVHPSTEATGPQCDELDSDDVQVVPHGFLLRSRDEFIAQDDVLPSRRDRYELCPYADRIVLLVPPEQF